MRTWLGVWTVLGSCLVCAGVVAEPATVLEIQYTPSARAQIAIWVEDDAGQYLTTLALTEAVAFRGLGNRPGASQLNSGYRWPYGRREGVLPIWARRRAQAPGAKRFPRVIYQARREGMLTKRGDDQSPDDYYCLANNVSRSQRDALDAVSCASVFNSDKGRYMTQQDLDQGYAEPFEARHLDPYAPAVGGTRALSLDSLYPPRMDVRFCSQPDACYDHEDVKRFASDARAIMPEIDAVTRATALSGTPQRVLFSVPASWQPGTYHVWLEANVEGDYLDGASDWSAQAYPTPTAPERDWDPYSLSYGYPYRGQPSVAYRVAIELGGAEAQTFATDAAAGRSSWDMDAEDYGELEPLSDGERPALAVAAGSGSDRLHMGADGQRLVVHTRQVEASAEDATDAQPNAPLIPDNGAGQVLPHSGGGVDGPVGPVGELGLSLHEDPLHAHQWLRLHFRAARSERPLHAYEVRVSQSPIVDEQSYVTQGRPAKTAAEGGEGATALELDVSAPEGALIETSVGDLTAATRYYVAVRAVDDQDRRGPISVASLRTAVRTFSTVTPCFVATAAYGSPLAAEIHALRRLRDRQLRSNALGRALVRAYMSVGPHAARWIAPHPELRAWVRALLTPLVALARSAP